MTHEGHPFWDAVEGRAEPPPVARLLGWKVLEAEVGSGAAKVQFDAPPELTTTGGRVQGGMLTALLDEAMYAATCTLLETHEYAPSISLSIHFLRPTVPGRLVAHTRVVQRGRSIAFVEGELRDADGRAIARASQSCRILSTRDLVKRRPGDPR